MRFLSFGFLTGFNGFLNFLRGLSGVYALLDGVAVLCGMAMSFLLNTSYTDINTKF